MMIIRHIVSFACGVGAAVALTLSGMTDPRTIWQFFTLTRPLPLLVFFGLTLAIYTVFQQHIFHKRCSTPLFAERFAWQHSIPSLVDVDLITGSVLFGLGWAITGLCPGPALVAAATGSLPGLLTLCGTVLGIGITVLVKHRHTVNNGMFTHLVRPPPRVITIKLATFVFVATYLLHFGYYHPVSHPTPPPHPIIAESNVNGTGIPSPPAPANYDDNGVNESSTLLLSSSSPYFFFSNPPIGILRTLSAALVMGLSLAIFTLTTGRVFGFSGILRQFFFTVSGTGHTNDDPVGIFAAVMGILSGAWIGQHLLSNNGAYHDYHSHVGSTNGLEIFFFGGILIGTGSTLANGCTSGHGICGVARFSRRSIVAIGLFMVSAFVFTHMTHSSLRRI